MIFITSAFHEHLGETDFPVFAFEYVILRSRGKDNYVSGSVCIPLNNLTWRQEMHVSRAKPAQRSKLCAFYALPSRLSSYTIVTVTRWPKLIQNYFGKTLLARCQMLPNYVS